MTHWSTHEAPSDQPHRRRHQSTSRRRRTDLRRPRGSRIPRSGPRRHWSYTLLPPERPSRVLPLSRRLLGPGATIDVQQLRHQYAVVLTMSHVMLLGGDVLGRLGTTIQIGFHQWRSASGHWSRLNQPALHPNSKGNYNDYWTRNSSGWTGCRRRPTRPITVFDLRRGSNQ